MRNREVCMITPSQNTIYVFLNNNISMEPKTKKKSKPLQIRTHAVSTSSGAQKLGGYHSLKKRLPQTFAQGFRIQFPNDFLLLLHRMDGTGWSKSSLGHHWPPIQFQRNVTCLMWENIQPQRHRPIELQYWWSHLLWISFLLKHPKEKIQFRSEAAQQKYVHHACNYPWPPTTDSLRNEEWKNPPEMSKGGS